MEPLAISSSIALALSLGQPKKKRTAKAALWLFVIGLATGSVYVFGSGGLQPGDLFLTAGMLLTLFQVRVRLNGSDGALALTLAALLGWIFCVNLAWYFEEGDAFLLRSTGWYLFNCLSLFAVIALVRMDRPLLVRSLLAAFEFGLFIQVVAVATLPSDHILREMGTFNNPNQLGYYAVLCASLVCFLGAKLPERSRRQVWMEYVALAAASYLSLVSFSRAAMGAMVLLYAVHFKVRVRRLIGMGMLLGFVYYLGVSGETTEELIKYLGQRTQSFQEEVLHRGYARIMEDPSMAFFGLGEGENTGMATFRAREVHSTFGNILFSYGIVGLLLVALLALLVVRRCGLSWARYLLPPMVYGLAHNGIRQTELWVLIGLIYSLDPLSSRLGQLGQMGPRGKSDARKRLIALSEERS